MSAEAEGEYTLDRKPQIHILSSAQRDMKMYSTYGTTLWLFS